MGGLEFDVRQAQQVVADARQRGDKIAEAVALTMLSQAFFESGQVTETHHINVLARQIPKEAADPQEILWAQHEALLDRGNELAEAAGPAPLIWLTGSTYPSFHTRYHLLSSASRAYQFAGTTLAGRKRNKAAQDAAFARAHDLLRLRDQGSGSQGRTIHGLLVQLGELVSLPEVVAGFVALKAAGPFLEAFAKKLGDQLGESTTRALGRIRLRPQRLEIEVPKQQEPLVLILPADFNDEVRLSIIELDALPEGGTMRWNPDMHTWERISR